ncbi:Proline-rich receptor-like protein kinase PERK1 [Carex littledalei]|uniref:non-specific serine/threonine protein kinase n=1 Tax=Carex littledalei TaxID=544730 RepID=A0A833QUJ5_9POAL|nr:Proline-rich receptor-like protein kinase PERK1 [Carex littledalei]
MPPTPNKYRGLMNPLIFVVLILPILLILYTLAFVIGLVAFVGGALTCCCGGNCFMNGLLVVADSFVEAGFRVFEGSMRRNGQQLKSLSYQSGSTIPPQIQYYTQNQLPMLVPSAQMPINRHANTAYQQRHLQQPLDSLSTVNITIDYLKSGFTHEELVEATNGFSAQNFLGEGGFGFVHRGILSDGREVAIKQLKSDNTWGHREFKAEVDVLSRVHHRHLVQYFGCFMTQDKRMIVCEYVPNKTVDYHLHGKHEDTIDWDIRLKISIGAAKGLAYLHEESDFGMAKIFPDGILLIVATNLVGTRGYLAPEFSMGEIREKSDTFSFGVVLLELITGKKPIITRPVFSEESNPFETLANWARPLLREALQNGNYDSLVDSRLRNMYNYDEMNRMIACAAACVQLSPQDRPLMSKNFDFLRCHISFSNNANLNNPYRHGILIEAMYKTADAQTIVHREQ